MSFFDERRSSCKDTHVCADCIGDDDLKDVIKANVDKRRCDYCERASEAPIAAPLEVVAERIWECVREEYEHPANSVPWESAEGGWQGTGVYDSYDLLFDHLGLDIENATLMGDIADSSPEPEWARQDWAALEPHERQVYGWAVFKHAVKHQRRYTFWTMEDSDEEPYHPDHLPVSRVLGEISAAINDTHLVKNLPEGSGFWRVRVHKVDIGLTQDHELCTPPIDLATQPNRMSPGGIPMFYGLEDCQTAVAETFDPSRAEGKAITCACFKATRRLRVLDLCDLPYAPGFFARGTRDIRETIHFLWQFADDLAQPIQRDGREHIDYVPSQAFTEFVRHGMKLPEGGAIDGIRYKSSRNGKACVVLFCEHENCIETDEGKQRERVLIMDTASVTRIAGPDLNEVVRKTVKMRHDMKRVRRTKRS